MYGNLRPKLRDVVIFYPRLTDRLKTGTLCVSTDWTGFIPTVPATQVPRPIYSKAKVLKNALPERHLTRLLVRADVSCVVVKSHHRFEEAGWESFEGHVLVGIVSGTSIRLCDPFG